MPPAIHGFPSGLCNHSDCTSAPLGLYNRATPLHPQFRKNSTPYCCIKYSHSSSLGHNFLAIRAKRFHEALSQNALQRLGKLIAPRHFQETRHGFRAEFVCRVEKTNMAGQRCFHTDWAVSTSRISPTRMTSGSARKNARMMRLKFRPIEFSTCTVQPGWVISTGSSTSRFSCSGVLIRPKTACSVVVFPEPVGPTTKKIPWACASNARSAPCYVRSDSTCQTHGLTR